MTNVHTEQIIHEVEIRPCLWDPHDSHYKNKDTKAKAWLEVCEASYPNYADSSSEEKKQIEKAVQLRWKTARDAYMKCRTTTKKLKTGMKKKYVYYENLTFLENTKNFEPKDDETATSSQNFYFQDVATTSSHMIEMAAYSPEAEHMQEAPASPKPWPKKRKRYLTVLESRLLKIIETNSNKDTTTKSTPSTALRDDDYSFFNSLAPIINDFDTRQKLLFRTGILELAMDIRNKATNSLNMPASTATNDLPHSSSGEDTTESWEQSEDNNPLIHVKQEVP